jgi:hypothetical protein
MTHLFIKLILSIMAGFIVAPWEIFKRVREIISINSLKKEVVAARTT